MKFFVDFVESLNYCFVNCMLSLILLEVLNCFEWVCFGLICFVWFYVKLNLLELRSFWLLKLFTFFYPGRTAHVLNVYTARATEPAFSGTTSNRSMNKKKRSNNKMYPMK